MTLKLAPCGLARYADDCNILVRSKRAEERVMASVTLYVGDTLRLTVNPLKSAVDRPNRKFLGQRQNDWQDRWKPCLIGKRASALPKC